MHRDPRFLALLDTIPVLIWSTDREGNWIYANRVWVEFTGSSAAAELGRGWTERIHPEDEPVRAAAIATHAAACEPFRLELRMRRRDGQWRWMLCSGVPRVDAEGAFIGFIGSSTDISEMRDAELQRRRDMDEKAAVMQELHHRVKNNAQVFASLLSVQASRASDPAVKAALRVAAARAATMAFAQQQIWDAGSSARFDLGALVRRLVRAQAVRGIDVEVQAPSKLFVPLATAVPLGLIVHELLTNALQHGFPSGGAGRVDILLERLSPSDLQVAISDNGVGMDETAQEGGARSAGLTIVRSLARQLGAALTTQVSGGTTISLVLPCPVLD